MNKRLKNEIIACAIIGKARLSKFAELYGQLGQSDVVYRWDCMIAGGMREDDLRGVPYVAINRALREALG